MLLINQSFYPDIAASGQYLTDLAIALQQQGAQVEVLTSQKAYVEQGNTIFPPRETYNGITIRRISLPGSRWRLRYLRMISSMLLNISFMFAYIFSPRRDRVVVLTSPPLLFWFIALANIFVHRSKLYSWSMDINPQQAIETGWVKKGGVFAKFLLAFNAFFLRRAKKIFVLDEAMRECLLDNGLSEERLEVLPLWADRDRLGPLPPHENAFRRKLLSDMEPETFIVMYSGNHSICHPLSTLLEAARELQQERILFLFVGGGARYSEVESYKERHKLQNIVCLPYQPAENLQQSLNAADLHVVSMGESYVGLVHPSKLYGVLATSTPILLLGPQQCPLAGVILKHNLGVVVEHGDSEGARDVISRFASLPVEEYEQYRQRVEETSKLYDRESRAGDLARAILE